MKLAVCYNENDEEIFQHFGHTKFFKVYEIQNAKIESVEVISAGDTGHEALADFLKARGVTALICGGIGQGAVNALNATGIEIYGGNQGKADAAAELFAQGKLEKKSAANCNRHGEGHDAHHGEGHHHGHHADHPKVNVKLF